MSTSEVTHLQSLDIEHYHLAENRVCTGHGKPGKSWNFTISFSRPGKSWNVSVDHGKSWTMNENYFLRTTKQKKSSKTSWKVMEFYKIRTVRTL